MVLQVVGIFARYKDILVDEKMMAQKGILPPDGEYKPWQNGLVTFAGFIFLGSTPLVSFIILIPFTDNETIKFVGTRVLSGLSLALLGIAKAKIAGEGYAASATVTVSNGAAAASAAYGLGWMLRSVATRNERRKTSIRKRGERERKREIVNGAAFSYSLRTMFCHV